MKSKMNKVRSRERELGGCDFARCTCDTIEWMLHDGSNKLPNLKPTFTSSQKTQSSLSSYLGFLHHLGRKPDGVDNLQVP